MSFWFQDDNDNDDEAIYFFSKKTLELGWRHVIDGYANDGGPGVV